MAAGSRAEDVERRATDLAARAEGNLLQILTAAECWQLLGTQEVGRVAFSERALPAILPLNYVLDGQRIMLRCGAEGLAQRLDGQVVAFEVDDVDRFEQSGWSVVVIGTASRLTHPGDLARSDTLTGSWAGPDHQTAVRITVGDIQGRLLSEPEPVMSCST